MVAIPRKRGLWVVRATKNRIAARPIESSADSEVQSCKASCPPNNPQTRESGSPAGYFLLPGRSKRGLGTIYPALSQRDSRLVLLLGLLGTIRCAATLALARVFAFATVVTRLAAALALAGVLALASMLFFGLLVVLLILALVLTLLLGAESRLQRRKQGRSLDCRTGAGEQSRERRTS